MTKHLPDRADLEHLKGQAKALLSSLKSGNIESLSRVDIVSDSYRLADAQRIVAKEYGFSSWPKLKRHLEFLPDRRVAFFRAVRGGDRKVVESLLGDYPSLVHSRDEGAFGTPAIVIAAERDDRPLIDLLLEHGADVNSRSDWWAGGFGVLDSGSEITARYFVSRGARLTAHAAARLGLVQELKQILSDDHSAVFERGGDGQYPLHFSKSPEIVDILCDAGAVLDARDLDHVSTAAQFRIKESPVCRRLIERGASPDVYIAIMLEDVPLLGSLIDNDPECLSRTPIHQGNPMIPLAPGFPIYTYNVGIGRPFQIAHKFVKLAAIKAIENRSTPVQKLLTACWLGDDVTANSFASSVTSLSSQDQSILAEAAWERKLRAVKLMLELGFPPDSTGVHHSSPLDRAAFHGFDDVIEIILNFCPSLTILNEFGGTPLRACIYGSVNTWRKDGNHARSVELLLAAGSPTPPKMKGSPEVNAVLHKHGIETE